MWGNSLGLAASPPTINETTLCPHRSTLRLFTLPPSTRAPNLTYSYTYSWYRAQSIIFCTIQYTSSWSNTLNQLTLRTLRLINFIFYWNCCCRSLSRRCCCSCRYWFIWLTTHNLLESAPTTQGWLDSVLTIIWDDFRAVIHWLASSSRVVMTKDTCVTFVINFFFYKKIVLKFVTKHTNILPVNSQK